MLITYLKLERAKKGLTQWDIAQVIQCSRGYISNLENLREEPSEEVAGKLEKYFNKSIDHLLKKIE